MTEQFTCGLCGETYDKAWTDEEAQKESERIFGPDIEDPEVVCDDCYKLIMHTGGEA
jgi:hypothetical protein